VRADGLFAHVRRGDGNVRPNVELSCVRRRGGPAAWSMMNLGATRPGCLAVARQLERHVRRLFLG